MRAIRGTYEEVVLLISSVFVFIIPVHRVSNLNFFYLDNKRIRDITMSCFSEECGFCSACSGDAGNKVVEYPLPKELYKMETGKEFTAPPEPKNPRDLLQKMMYYFLIIRYNNIRHIHYK